MDAIPQVIGRRAIRRFSSAGVVMEHYLHCVTLAVADGGRVNASVQDFTARPLPQRENRCVEVALFDAERRPQNSNATGHILRSHWKIARCFEAEDEGVRSDRDVEVAGPPIHLDKMVSQ